MISRIKGLIASSMQLGTNNTASPAMAGDVAYWDGSKVKTTPLSSWSTELGTPVGVVVVPTGFAPDGKARIVSLNYVDESGNTSTSTVYMCWGVYGTDTNLTNFTKVPITDNAGSTSSGSNDYGYLPSDTFTGNASFVDPKAKYAYTPMIPSPYNGEEPNPDYYMEILENNALSDFNGLHNTQKLVGLGSKYVAANAAYKYKDGVSNLQWYLPAIGEFGYIMPRFNVINNTITALGGVYVNIGSAFWSSSEYSSDYAYHLFAKTGAVDKRYKNSTTSYVRPFAILDNGENSGGNNGENSGDSSNSPITFYLKDTHGDLHQFNAPYSMTWGDFVVSEYNTVNELGDKSFRDVGVIQYGDIFSDLTPDGRDYYTEYREIYKNDVAAGNYVFPDEYIREDVNYMTL